MSTPKSPSFSSTTSTKDIDADSTTTTNKPVAGSAIPNSNKKNVTSEASRKDLIHYVNIINLFLNTSVHTDGDTRLQLAIQHLYEGLEFYPDAYELKVIGFLNIFLIIKCDFNFQLRIMCMSSDTFLYEQCSEN
jgi:hypothetical protein